MSHFLLLLSRPRFKLAKQAGRQLSSECNHIKAQQGYFLA